MSLIGIIRNAIEGKQSWSDVRHKIEALVGASVIDPLKLFTNQFASDFGKQALKIAADDVTKVLAGASIKDVAANIVSQLSDVAVTVAEKDGTVALNALRVHLTALAVQADEGTPAASSTDNGQSS